jgi:hypothetical protein
MRPVLDPAGHRALEPSQLVLSTPPASPATTFRACPSPAPTQVKPQPALVILSQNQSAQRCQSLITPGSDHPPVLEPHMVLDLPLDECIDNTHI